MIVYTTGGIAKALCVSIHTVNKWVDSGRLEGYRIPSGRGHGHRHRRVTHTSLVKFMNDNGLQILLPRLENIPLPEDANAT